MTHNWPKCVKIVCITVCKTKDYSYNCRDWLNGTSNQYDMQTYLTIHSQSQVYQKSVKLHGLIIFSNTSNVVHLSFLIPLLYNPLS